MSKLRALTARFGAGRKHDSDDPRTQADGATAASATDEQDRPEEVDDPLATSDAAAALAQFEADGAALREGGQAAALDPDATPDPQRER